MLSTIQKGVLGQVSGPKVNWKSGNFAQLQLDRLLHDSGSICFKQNDSKTILMIRAIMEHAIKNDLESFTF